MLFHPLSATQPPSQPAQPDAGAAPGTTPAEPPAAGSKPLPPVGDSSEARSLAHQGEPREGSPGAATRDQRPARFLPPAWAWILIAAVVATAAAVLAVRPAFRSGGPETTQASRGQPATGPERLAPQQAAEQRPATESTSETASQSGDRRIEATPPKTRIAHSLEEVKQALVKIETPLGVGDLMEFGTGFLIDGRGWIATNEHVAARMTKDSRVKLADGAHLELAGFLARSPQHDLAIVQLKAPPADLPILDIRYEGRAPLGEEVYAFGHPYGAEFSLTKGIVSRVLTTAELPNSSRLRLATRLRPPDDMVWIQHDAKISPGNSGGPLIDETGRVLGANTFIHLKAEFGFASSVKHLRELVDAVSGAVEPLPDSRQGLQTVVSSQRIDQLFDVISAFEWRPATAEQYGSVAEFAKQMTLAKHAQSVQRLKPDKQSAIVQRVALAADQKFAELQHVAWSGEKFHAMNAFACDQMDNALEGVFLYCSVLGSVPDHSALLMEIAGTRDLFLLRVGPNMTKAQRGSRWLVLGFVTPQVGSVQTRSQSEPRPARVVLTHYMILIR